MISSYREEYTFVRIHNSSFTNLSLRVITSQCMFTLPRAPAVRNLTRLSQKGPALTYFM